MKAKIPVELRASVRDLSLARQQGYAARRAGYPRSDNPHLPRAWDPDIGRYAEGGPHAAWNQGWDQGDRDIRFGKEDGA
ncbi:MAG: hypothetical protein AAB368_14160 [bacterium]